MTLQRRYLGKDNIGAHLQQCFGIEAQGIDTLHQITAQLDQLASIAFFCMVFLANIGLHKSAVVAKFIICQFALPPFMPARGLQKPRLGEKSAVARLNPQCIGDFRPHPE